MSGESKENDFNESEEYLFDADMHKESCESVLNARFLLLGETGMTPSRPWIADSSGSV